MAKSFISKQGENCGGRRAHRTIPYTHMCCITYKEQGSRTVERGIVAVWKRFAWQIELCMGNAHVDGWTCLPTSSLLFRYLVHYSFSTAHHYHKISVVQHGCRGISDVSDGTETEESSSRHCRTIIGDASQWAQSHKCFSCMLN